MGWSQGPPGRDRLRRIARSAAALLVAVISFGCRSDARPGETTAERIRRTGVVRIAYANEAPFGYRDPNTGRVTGEAPEIARVVLEQMGVERIDTSLVEFGQLIPGLEAKRFDLAAAGMYITPARCQRISFSNPSYCVGEAFLVRAGNPRDLHGYADVRDDPDASLGVTSGTVELSTAEAVGIREAQIVIFPDNVTALAGLRTGRIDAFAATELTVDDVLERIDGDLEKAQPFTQPQVAGHTRNCGAFGFRKGDDTFRDEFDRHLGELIGSPAHLDLVGRFGFSADNLPAAVTARELCRPQTAATDD